MARSKSMRYAGDHWGIRSMKVIQRSKCYCVLCVLASNCSNDENIGRCTGNSHSEIRRLRRQAYQVKEFE